MQAEGDLQEYNFRINTEKLEHEFTCTICLNPINDCYITRCGHVYCYRCIEEAVNRHHRCPFCNQELKDFKQDVFKNYHFNTLKKIIDDEKLKENQKYLNKVFEKIAKQKADLEGENQLMGPIEQTILTRCEEALLKYRQYALELYDSLKQTEEKKLLLGAGKARENQQIIKELQGTLLAALPNPVVAPDIISLSTRIEVLLPNKKTFKSSISLAPMAPLACILPFLENVCSEFNARIQGKMPEVLTINGEERSLEERVGALAGKQLVVEGIPLEVNIYCYTHGWEKGKATNFYWCKTCKVKWLCENCSILCHKGHDYALQLKDHKPDWACCYCVTKCDCQAINKNSVIKSL